jgi:hypothetical protein
LHGIVAAFTRGCGENPKVSGYVEVLLVDLNTSNGFEAMGALKGLAGLDFTKDQLALYKRLLNHAVPLILESNFDLENGEVGKAVELLKSKNIGAASNAINRALKHTETNSLQYDLLDGLIESYAPLLKEMDLSVVAENGKKMIDSVESPSAEA